MSSHPELNCIFVAGTGTDVGKTYCAQKWLQTRRRAGRRVAAYKPVASGCTIDAETRGLRSTDADSLWRASGRSGRLDDVCPQKFIAATSPPVAAAIENRHVDESLLVSGVDVWCDGSVDDLLIEGAGGLFSPISDSMLNLDLVVAVKRRLPRLRLVLVAIDQLGVQHQVISTVRAAESSGCVVDEIWLNVRELDESVSTNAAEIARFCNVPVVRDGW